MLCTASLPCQQTRMLCERERTVPAGPSQALMVRSSPVAVQ